MSKQEKNCQIPTPGRYVKQMLDYIGYKYNLRGQKVLENSCGEGNILVEIVKRYIADLKENQYTPREIAGGLEKDIVAYEVDLEKIEICLNRLNELASFEGLPEVKWNIKQQDFLKSVEQNVDFVIGNPPYVTYHDLTQEERVFLKERFQVCREGRFDYCYAFIEASVRALADNGKMIYLIPFSIFRNRYASGLRSFLGNCITKIVDYRSIHVFPGITCSTSLILCEKGCVQNTVEYVDSLARKKVCVDRSSLREDGSKWIFQHSILRNRRFGDFFSVHNSVATLCNKAFLFTAEQEEENYYIIGGMPVEKEVTLPAISVKSSRAMEKGKGCVRIIYPYKLVNGKVIHYSEEEFQAECPCAWRYLSQFCHDLKKRKADEKAKWFEYGRSQALAEVLGEKLIIPMVITNSTRAYIAKQNEVPYAGYFVKAKQNCDLTLADAKKVLESESFYQYVQEVGTPTTLSSFRVSVNDINEFLF